jgi:CRP-like cAMP-binding protein
MDSTEVERLERLRAIPLFDHLSDGSLRSVLECVNEFEAPRGQVLVQPAEAGAGLFIVEEGTVIVELRDRQVELGEGQFFGELSLLTEAGHIARVRAKTPVRCLALRRDEFDRLLESEPSMAMAMLKALARRMAESGAR